MKRQVRFNVFETNSSSTHSLVLCTDDDYVKWANGEMFFDDYLNVLVSIEEINKDEKLKSQLENQENDKRFYTRDEFFNEYYEETYHDSIVTQNEIVHAFGYYG